MGYRENPTQFVKDLRTAADAGNWDQYTAVQGQLAIESTLWALRQAEAEEAQEKKESNDGKPTEQR